MMCPMEYFICPDGDHRPIEQCLKKCPRDEGRCLSLPTLIAIADRRPWVGKPSTTQLLNGTRLSYLQITQDYSVDPSGRAFALLGSEHHYRFEVIAKKLNALAEEKLEGDVAGILDLLVPDETTNEEFYELWDYKTSGSFKIAKALGIVSKKIPDPSGEVYKTSGKWGKAGSPKMVTVFEHDAQAVDMWDWELQLNNYRMMVEACGFPVSKMVIQATIRDGGTFVAHNRGVEKNIELISVNRLDDDIVKGYFASKAYELLQSLKEHEANPKYMPPPCDAKESWDGRRCQAFCDVWEFCDIGIEAHKKGGGNE